MSAVISAPRASPARLRARVKRCGRLAILALERCEGALALSEALLGALQRTDLFLGALELRRKLRDALAVLAREPLERRGLALDLLLPCRVHVERIEIVPEGVRGLAHENGGLAEELRRRAELGVRLQRGTQRRGGLGEEVVRARALLVVYRIERTARRLSESPATGNALLLREQRLDVGGGGDLGLELGELVTQQVEPRVAVLRGRPQRFVFLAADTVTPVQIGHRGSLCRREPRVEELALRAALHEVLVLLLSVDLDE